jgi:hypothetical protein
VNVANSRRWRDLGIEPYHPRKPCQTRFLLDRLPLWPENIPAGLSLHSSPVPVSPGSETHFFCSAIPTAPGRQSQRVRWVGANSRK